MLEQLDRRIALARAAQLRAVMAGQGWEVNGWAITFWRQTFLALERKRQGEVRLGAY